MKTSGRFSSSHLIVFSAAMVFALSAGISSVTNAAVVVTNDPATLLKLEKPTGKPDEPGLSGFEYLLSGRTGEFRANDQYLIAGEQSLPSTTLANDLGGVTELSGIPLHFSIKHNLVGGRNFTFMIADPQAGTSSVLCWGLNCAAGSISAETINGLAPITQYNGLQIQVRAQVPQSSVTISNLSLTGVTIAPGSAPLISGTVTPATTSTIPGDANGRIGQWIIGDSLDLFLNEWELSGTIILERGDQAINDITMVRLAVDLVNDTTQTVVPLPASVWLFGSALLGLLGRWHRR